MIVNHLFCFGVVGSENLLCVLSSLPPGSGGAPFVRSCPPSFCRIGIVVSSGCCSLYAFCLFVQRYSFLGGLFWSSAIHVSRYTSHSGFRFRIQDSGSLCYAAAEKYLPVSAAFLRSPEFASRWCGLVANRGGVSWSSIQRGGRSR